MGSKAKKDRKNVDILDEDDEVDFDIKTSKNAKQGEVKGLLNSIIADEIKGSSRPPSPASFSLEGRKPAEIFRTDLISAMKMPEHQNLNPENYITISDQWRQEWERGVQVPVNPESVFQPSFRPVEPSYKRTGNFKQPAKLLSTPSTPIKARGRPPASKCPYDLGRMDVEWLTSLNKSRHNKGLVELEETQLEKAMAYIENKCYDNMGHAISTQEGLSIEYDEDVCCDVCQSPDSEETNEMVFCDICDICVHQACYGIQNIPAGSWICHPCRKGIKNCQCILCPLSGGAMKKTKNGKGWVHVSCALWVPEVGFGNIPKMEPVTRIENIPASRWNLVCSLCREKVGACIQCTVKSCVTAFHVTCGFKHELEMKTVLDDSATDGVRHISYCTKHSHKSKSPNKKIKEGDKETSRSSEDAENLRQKRLKQMEEEFHKYVSPAEIAKDLNHPKELATKIHMYWALKRKAQDDVPLLPPTLQQQEKLSGKQGAVNSSSNLQIQLERIVKLRCNLEKLRNLCYMVTKREKMRRELYRAREEVFWQELAVMTDESCDMDEEAVQSVLTMCKNNFSGDGSLPTDGDGSLVESLSSRVSSTMESSSTTSSLGDCSSTEQDSGGGGCDTDATSRGGAAEQEVTPEMSEEEEEEAEVEVLTPARRTRSNSHLVVQSSLTSQAVDSSEAGPSKELPSTVTSDSETPSRKRTRTKAQSFSEDSTTTPKRVLRNTITELKGVEHISLELFEKPRRRLTRHLSFPNDVKEAREDSDKETVGGCEEECQSSDVVSRETRIRFSRAGKAIKKPEIAKTGSEVDSLEKPEVNEKESRKENAPLRPENIAELKRTGNRAKKGVKRKRSKSTTAVDENARSKQARITDYLRRKSPKELRSLKSPRTRANTKNSDSEESDQIKADTDVETNAKRVPTPRSFTNGRETTSDCLCPRCKLQHDKLAKCSWRCKEGSHTAECEDNWNRRELRVRTGFQSPKSRARCSHVVSSKPHCCSSLMTKFCHATVT